MSRGLILMHLSGISIKSFLGYILQYGGLLILGIVHQPSKGPDGSLFDFSRICVAVL